MIGTSGFDLSEHRNWILVLLSIAVAWIDWKHYRISNRSVIVTFVLGLTWNGWLYSSQGMQQACLGATTGFALLLPGYALGQLSAGDVKWLCALGAWYGPLGILSLFLIASIAHGVLAILWIARRYSKGNPPDQEIRNDPAATPGQLDVLYDSPDRGQLLLPYAVPVAVGVILIELARIIRMG